MSLSQRATEFRATPRPTMLCVGHRVVWHSYGVSFGACATTVHRSYNGTSLRHVLAPVTPRSNKGLHHRSPPSLIIITKREKNTGRGGGGSRAAIRYLISVTRKLGLVPSRFLGAGDVFGAPRRAMPRATLCLRTFVALDSPCRQRRLYRSPYFSFRTFRVLRTILPYTRLSLSNRNSYVKRRVAKAISLSGVLSYTYACLVQAADSRCIWRRTNLSSVTSFLIYQRSR